MSEQLLGLVVTHGEVAAGLVQAAESITGIEGALVAISNRGCNTEDLGLRIDAVAGDAPVVVFVDMPVGSCLQAAARSVRDNSTRTLVAGVNLAMLIDFCFHRNVSPVEAAERAVSQGLASIKPLGL